jgi:hypothetical protein
VILLKPCLQLCLSGLIGLLSLCNRPIFGPFFEAFFFGGLKTNYKLEQNFSVFGAHIQDEQSASLKEAIVFHNLQLQKEREARRSESFRVPKKSTAAQQQYAIDRAARQAQGQSEELPSSDDNRLQLVTRANQLLERMHNTAHRLQSAKHVIDIKFQERRNKNWKMLYEREAAALEGIMRVKRRSGKHRMSTDPFGAVRERMRQGKQPAKQPSNKRQRKK